MYRIKWDASGHQHLESSGFEMTLRKRDARKDIQSTLRLYSEEPKLASTKDSCRPEFATTLLIITKLQVYAMHSSKDDRVKKIQ